MTLVTPAGAGLGPRPWPPTALPGRLVGRSASNRRDIWHRRVRHGHRHQGSIPHQGHRWRDRQPADQGRGLPGGLPGRDALASDLVAEALKKCSEKKPVIVSQGAVAGSGGYWISMYGDKIVAAPQTITGSIGVIGGWIYNAGLKEKLGMTTDLVKAGQHADIGFGMTLPLLGPACPTATSAKVSAPW